MSDRSAKSAPTSGAELWVHEIVTSSDGGGPCGLMEEGFAKLLNDYCADGWEIVAYSVATPTQIPLHSALLRRRATEDEHHEIHKRRVDRLEGR